MINKKPYESPEVLLVEAAPEHLFLADSGFGTNGDPIGDMNLPNNW